jgi:hypothetical protein
MAVGWDRRSSRCVRAAATIAIAEFCTCAQRAPGGRAATTQPALGPLGTRPRDQLQQQPTASQLSNTCQHSRQQILTPLRVLLAAAGSCRGRLRCWRRRTAAARAAARWLAACMHALCVCVFVYEEGEEGGGLCEVAVQAAPALPCPHQAAGGSSGDRAGSQAGKRSGSRRAAGWPVAPPQFSSWGQQTAWARRSCCLQQGLSRPGAASGPGSNATAAGAVAGAAMDAQPANSGCGKLCVDVLTAAATRGCCSVDGPGSIGMSVCHSNHYGGCCRWSDLALLRISRVSAAAAAG